MGRVRRGHGGRGAGHARRPRPRLAGRRPTRLYLVPSTKALLAPTWTRLEELAAAGATVYVSYCAGEHSWQRGPWWAEMNRIFGVEHQLRYGLVEPVSGPVELAVATPFGDLPAGVRLAFTAAGTENSRSYLPVRAVDAEVLLTDAHGRPALLSRPVGDGRMVLGTYPVEHFAAATPGVNPEDTHRLYRALAAEAGVRTAATVRDPQVHVEALDHPDGRRFVWVLSRHDDGAVADVETGTELVDAVTGERVPAGARVPLEPFGVRVLRVVG